MKTNPQAIHLTLDIPRTTLVGISTLTCYLSRGESQCVKFCSCSCHRKSFHMKTPTLVERLVGRLIVGLTIDPWMRGTCDDSRCLRSRKAVLQCQYTFPSRLLAYCINVVATPLKANGSDLVIHLPGIRPHTRGHSR